MGPMLAWPGNDSQEQLHNAGLSSVGCCPYRVRGCAHRAWEQQGERAWLPRAGLCSIPGPAAPAWLFRQGSDRAKGQARLREGSDMWLQGVGAGLGS